MDILDRLLGHDSWTTRALLARSKGLSDEQLDRRFPIGHGSLRATFVHIIWNMEAWTDLICERVIRPRPGPEAATVARLIERLDAVAAEFGTVARQLRDDGRLNGLFHLITHSMHHRAQVLNMMRHLGMTDLIEGDVLGWERAQSLANDTR
jgi:uncharacterized damage-inducible protein DinB